MKRQTKFDSALNIREASLTSYGEEEYEAASSILDSHKYMTRGSNTNLYTRIRVKLNTDIPYLEREDHIPLNITQVSMVFK